MHMLAIDRPVPASHKFHKNAYHINTFTMTPSLVPLESVYVISYFRGKNPYTHLCIWYGFCYLISHLRFQYQLQPRRVRPRSNNARGRGIQYRYQEGSTYRRCHHAFSSTSRCCFDQWSCGCGLPSIWLICSSLSFFFRYEIGRGEREGGGRSFLGGRRGGQARGGEGGGGGVLGFLNGEAKGRGATTDLGRWVGVGPGIDPKAPTALSSHKST